MNYKTFQDFLNCVYIASKEVNYQPSRDEIFEGLLSVYSGETPDISSPGQDTVTRTPQGVKLVGAGMVKVVHRCKDAKEAEKIDLSDCSLMQVPDVVYSLMKVEKVFSCNLSNNLITKISPRFGPSFGSITSLNLSSNRISSLPNEIVQCSQLRSVDLSVNSFVNFPSILLDIDSITDINNKNNFIADVDDEALGEHPNLKILNLEENPLDQNTHARLSRMEGIRIVLTERRLQEWEDLSC